MDIDNMKNKTMRIKAPEVGVRNSEHAGEPTQSLVDLLKATDQQHLKKTRQARMFIMIATAAFLFAFVMTLLDPGSDDRGQERQMMYGSFVLVYILVSIVYVAGVRKLARVDHAVPVRQFLQEAERRYRFMQRSDLILSLVGLLAVIIVTTIGYAPYLSRLFGFGDDPTAMYILFPCFIIIVAAFGFYFTWKNWRRDRAPLWHQIRQMQDELESSSNDVR